MTGMLGYVNGKLSINSMFVQYYIVQGICTVVGIKGLSNGSSMDAQNIYIQIQTENNQTGLYFGAFATLLQADLQIISNISIENSIITAQSLVELVAAGTHEITVKIFNIIHVCVYKQHNYFLIQNIVFNNQYIVYSIKYSISITDSKVTSITILAYGSWANTGMILSNNGFSTMVVSGVSSDGTNMINLSFIGNCAQVINSYSQSGC
ncbi:Hypothetical_protein [Hexamita inflata]|uniref:Hypothetical_protein n=1 Tax=Hexamita inflata TaxID=28002 RepID=A0AA86VRB1_9EUKA|nr:Hypothetical protein HINF_LOCUS61953 [Hexamita inflata]